VFRVCVVHLRGGSLVVVVVVVVGIFIFFRTPKGGMNDVTPSAFHYYWRLWAELSDPAWVVMGWSVGRGGFAEWGCGAVGGVVGGERGRKTNVTTTTTAVAVATTGLCENIYNNIIISFVIFYRSGEYYLSSRCPRSLCITTVSRASAS